MITVKLKTADISSKIKLMLISELKKQMEKSSSLELLDLLKELETGKTYTKYREPFVIYRFPEFFEVTDDSIDTSEKEVDYNQEMLDMLDDILDRNDLNLAMQFCRLYKERPIFYGAMG